MLRGNNDNKLILTKVPELCIPFYQIWQELVDGRTLDVYQCRVLTSLSALKELDSVILKTLTGLFNSDANIEACRDETLNILNQDTILEHHNKLILNRIKASLGKKPSSYADKNRLLYQIRYILNEIEPTYLELAVKELKDSIIRKSIGEIEKYANIVASQAINGGWSSHALFDLLRIFRCEGEFDVLWNRFENELINLNVIKHHVLINIPFPSKSNAKQKISLISLENLGLNVKTAEEIITEFSNVTDINSLIKSNKRYFHITVNAKDIYAASHAAITKI